MRKEHVQVGGTYLVKVSGKLTPVRLEADSPYGGWVGLNLSTGRRVHIRSAGRLRLLLKPRPERRIGRACAHDTQEEQR